MRPRHRFTVSATTSKLSLSRPRDKFKRGGLGAQHLARECQAVSGGDSVLAGGRVMRRL